MQDKTRAKYYGIYRGIVLDNVDTGLESGKISGRCKIFFEGIYPDAFRKNNGELLPWAEPVYPLFGGNGATSSQEEYDKNFEGEVIKNYTNAVVGWNSVPHVGAMVWGFFEDGNLQFPKFFGTSQMGDKFMPEHKNQHVLATDNVKIIIDEEPENAANTSNLTDSNNDNSTVTSNLFLPESLKKEQMPTTVNITIVANKPENGKRADKDYCAININVIGNVNIGVKGNVYESIEGDKFITQKGNLYHRVEGDIEFEHEGNYYETHYGNRSVTVNNGDNKEYYQKNRQTTVVNNDTLTVNGNREATISGNESRTASGNITDKGAVIKLN